MTLSQEKEKIIRRERQCIENNNLTVKLLNGDDIKEEHKFFYDCYLDTTGRKWGSTYLTKEFFFEILHNLEKNITYNGLSRR